MKTIAKRAAQIIAIILCALLIATLILGLIRIRPLNNIGEYNRVQVITSYNENQHENKDVIDEAIATVKFSVLRSIYESNTDFGIKVNTKTETNDDGDEIDVDAYMSAAEFAQIAANAGEFMLKFSFDDIQTNKRFVTLSGEKIRYDSLILIIPKSDKKLTEVKLYPYIDDNIGNLSTQDKFDDNWFIGSAYYNVYEFAAKMHTYDMYEVLSKEFTAGKYQSSTGIE